MSTDLSFITNEKNQSLKSRFEVLIKDTFLFDCLVGYFYTSGFHALYKSLEKTERIRIFNIKYLLGILNSKLIHFYLGTIAETSGIGVSRWINNYVKEFPIVQTSDDKQKEIVKLVDRILAAKSTNQRADTSSAWESEIDQMVYQLYGLTEEEIRIVEERVGV